MSRMPRRSKIPRMAEPRTPTCPPRALLSVVIPVYNEQGTWRELLARVEAAPLPGIDKQIVLVEDGSTDGTRAELEAFAEDVDARGEPAPGRARPYKVLFHDHNKG